MTKYFYSLHAADITAVDFDSNAIEIAKKRNMAHNIDFKVCDIRNSLPIGKFNNIVWDAAIEHFTESEIDSIMCNIRESLTTAGVLSGYTVLEKESGEKHLHQHEYEFKSKDDLARFFSPHFTSVQILETQYPSRTNLYFFASNGVLPFLGASQLTIKN
jgi:cyclopropane fatty-acyl-phospholipid synthase-like methyltransferase